MRSSPPSRTTFECTLPTRRWPPPPSGVLQSLAIEARSREEKPLTSKDGVLRRKTHPLLHIQSPRPAAARSRLGRRHTPRDVEETNYQCGEDAGPKGRLGAPRRGRRGSSAAAGGDAALFVDVDRRHGPVPHDVHAVYYLFLYVTSVRSHGSFKRS